MKEVLESSEPTNDGEIEHQNQGVTELGLRLLWFHHIKSQTKRRDIVDWARELGLRGFCKPGYPGIIVCEGEQPHDLVSL